MGRLGAGIAGHCTNRIAFFGIRIFLCRLEGGEAGQPRKQREKTRVVVGETEIPPCLSPGSPANRSNFVLQPGRTQTPLADLIRLEFSRFICESG